MRLVRRLVVVLVVAFAVNAVVMVAVSALVNPHARQRTGGRIDVVTLSDQSTWMLVYSSGPGTRSVMCASVEREAGRVTRADSDLPRAWVRSLEALARKGNAAPRRGHIEERGWPRPCAWCRAPAVGMPRDDLAGGVVLPLGPWMATTLTGAPWPGPPRALPLRPIWSGLAVNLVFYALVVVLGHGTLRRMRQLRRFNRGGCPLCGYDRRHVYTSPCPECGARSAGRPCGAGSGDAGEQD